MSTSVHCDSARKKVRFVHCRVTHAQCCVQYDAPLQGAKALMRSTCGADRPHVLRQGTQRCDPPFAAIAIKGALLHSSARRHTACGFLSPSPPEAKQLVLLQDGEGRPPVLRNPRGRVRRGPRRRTGTHELRRARTSSKRLDISRACAKIIQRLNAQPDSSRGAHNAAVNMSIRSTADASISGRRGLRTATGCGRGATSAMPGVTP